MFFVQSMICHHLYRAVQIIACKLSYWNISSNAASASWVDVG